MHVLCSTSYKSMTPCSTLLVHSSSYSMMITLQLLHYQTIESFLLSPMHVLSVCSCSTAARSQSYYIYLDASFQTPLVWRREENLAFGYHIKNGKAVRFLYRMLRNLELPDISHERATMKSLFYQPPIIDSFKREQYVFLRWLKCLFCPLPVPRMNLPIKR